MGWPSIKCFPALLPFVVRLHAHLRFPVRLMPEPVISQKLIDEYIGGVYSKNEGFELDRLHIPAAGQEPSTLPERIPALSMDTVHKGEP